MIGINKEQALTLLKRCVVLRELSDANPNDAIPLILRNPDGTARGVSELSTEGRSIAAHFAAAPLHIQDQLLAMPEDEIRREFADWPAHDRDGLVTFLAVTRKLRNAIDKAKEDAPPAAERIKKLCIRKNDLVSIGITIDILQQTPNLLLDKERLLVFDRKVLEELAGMNYDQARNIYRNELGY